MEILQSNQGGSKLYYEGFIYTRPALRKTKKCWKCTLKSSRGCRGSLSTDLQYDNPSPGQPHNHAPDEASINCTKLQNSMKEKARSSHNAPSQIFAESVSNCVDADLPEGIAYIRSVIPEEPAETEELVNYFDATYVTGTYRPVQRNGEQRLTMRRVPPMFPPSIWSVHSATVDSDPGTNNVCEGWNNTFFTLVGSAHPSLWTCIQWFQREHATVTTVIQHEPV